MLQVQHGRKDYGAATILADITFLINHGEHVGLIGPNGTGKSTLLRCIIGQEQLDSGTISGTARDDIGYLAQSFDYPLDVTVGAMVTAAQASFVAASHALQCAADALASAEDMDAAMSRYDEALARFEALGGYEREHRAETVLHGLGLGDIEDTTLVAVLSGGQKTRLGLATLLLQEPELLLLDEPTNHLDVEALEWLEGFVQSYSRAALIVSHDRVFLDRTVTRILYLDPETRTVQSYAGNYSDFAAAREHERALHVETYKKQQEYVSRVEGDIARLKGQALGVELSTTPAQPTIRRYAKKVAKKAKSRERKLERYLESGERVDKPKQTWNLKLDFGAPPTGGRAVLRVEGVSFAYGQGSGIGYQVLDASPQHPTPNTQHLLTDVSFDVDYGERVAIVGPNGAGKTTLLKLLAGELEPIGGRIRLGAGVRLGVLAQGQETLDPTQTVLATVLRERAMSETDARNFLHFFLFGGDGALQRVGACSLGERSRLQLALLVLRGCNLLLLDEPLNHLDIEGREHFEAALNAFEGTVIAVAHDRAFVESFAERVIEIRDGQVRKE